MMKLKIASESGLIGFLGADQTSLFSNSAPSFFEDLG